MADMLARFRSELRAWREAHPGATDEEEGAAFPLLSLHKRAGGNPHLFVRLLEMAGRLKAVDG